MTKNRNNFATIVLAGGAGKRMKSDISKVLHPIGGKPMLERSLELIDQIKPQQTVIVANPVNLEPIKDLLGNRYQYATQQTPLGTANASKVGLSKIDPAASTIMVVNGDDSAFYKAQTLKNILDMHIHSENVLTFASLVVNNPHGLGRVVRDHSRLVAIIEEKDATEIELKIKEINTGLYVFNADWLRQNIDKVTKSPVSGEYYIVDLVTVALNSNHKVGTFTIKNTAEWHGINTPEELIAANRKLVKNIHIMGIAGSGAAAVGGIAQGYGYEVSGCDLNPVSSYTNFAKQNFANLKVRVQQGHSSSHLKSIDMLVISPAITKLDSQNPEVVKATKIGIPVLTWQEFQGKYLQPAKFVISVAGAYGKSTTTAMISQILVDQKLDPTCEVGAKVLAWNKNFRVGKSKYYVCEADEYNDNFLNFEPDIAVILNIAWEHPDYFKDEESIISSYRQFVQKIKKGGHLILGSEQKLKVLTNLRTDIVVITIDNFDPIELSIIGEFRKENAHAALTVARALSLDIEKAKKTLSKFRGLGRRLEYKGVQKGVKIFDDYAVQPYTVLTTVNALKRKFRQSRLCLVFEPHTFTRINTFFDEFAQNLRICEADRIFVTEVYAARETGDRAKLAKRLAGAVGPKATFIGSLIKTANYLKDNMANFDIILSMGAGDVYKIYDMLKK